ncbi:hypothetical protein [Polyangium sorediatum]|uniref:hypothetical protein n=1 Tax=Polyangium sorediatum TaxID=889274 RepID=UPI00318322C8
MCDVASSGDVDVVRADDDVVPDDVDVVARDSVVLGGNVDVVRADDDVVPGDVDVVGGDDDVIAGDDDVIAGDDDVIAGDDDVIAGDDDVIAGDSTSLKATSTCLEPTMTWRRVASTWIHVTSAWSAKEAGDRGDGLRGVRAAAMQSHRAHPALTQFEVSGRISAMLFQRTRTLLSLGLLGCVTMALVPLGCGAKITYPAASEGPRVPDATAERLRACADEFGGDLDRGSYTFDYKVLVDEEGRVVDVASKGVPHADLAGCTRIALRGMTVPEDLLRLRKLRLSESPAPANGQTMPERGLVGEVVIVTVTTVTIVFVDILIEAGVATMVFAVTMEIAKDVAEALRKRPKWENECNRHRTACLETPVQSEHGDTWNSSKCNECYKQCMAEKWWPTAAPWESCIYPNIKW